MTNDVTVHLFLLPEGDPGVTYVQEPGIHVQGKGLHDELPEFAVFIELCPSLCREEERGEGMVKRREW